ncbi:MAG: protein dehydratase [Ahrensia sp.]|nr:protein dehydratase [Ahrensia sp.]
MVGTTQAREDVLTQGLIDKYRATFGTHLWDGAGDVPLGIHWCMALDTVPGSSLSEDGHAVRGGFLPPVPLPAHMWAGGDVIHIAPLKIGETFTRRSVIGDITAKQGRSGVLVFVSVEHEHLSGNQLCIREQQSIVYRQITAPRPVKNAPAAADPTTLRSSLAPDPVLLFRYSALTFNAHRIHYDHVYATQTEAYPGLVVHGPLQATLLLNLAASTLHDPPHQFSFRVSLR